MISPTALKKLAAQHGTPLFVVDHAIVPPAQQALDHPGPHAAEADHSELHGVWP